jgi:two-component system CheB/CheR fusion protein
MDMKISEFRRHSRRFVAVLRALIRRSAASATDKRDYADRLECRVGALARVQEMILRTPAEGVDLHELILDELLAQVIPQARCRISGPNTQIAADAALPLALVLHELAVNSIIHGAMQDAAGRLEVSWQHIDVAGKRLLRLTWLESGSAAMQAPSAKGFGFELIERSLPYELDARTSVDWLPSGLRVEIEIPTLPSVQRWAAVAAFPS